MRKSFRKAFVLGIATVAAVTCVNVASGRRVNADSEIIYGDVDSDGKVTLKDAKISLKSSLGISNSEIKNVKAADANKDGKLSIKDSKVILQLSLGMGTLEEILARPEPTNPPVKPSKPLDQNTSGENTAYARKVLDLVNVERAKYNLAPLSWDVTLAAAAQARAVETTTYFSHTRPNGSNCFTILDEMGISYWGCGENIAMGQTSPEQVMNSWMNSEGHRANILKAEFTKLGVGCVKGANGAYYWTQLFVY